MRVRSVNFFAVVLAAAVTIEFTGCGASDRGTVSGTLVHMDGTPVARARVIARSNDTGATAYATTDTTGQFKMGDGLTPGNYAVFVVEDLGDPDNRSKPTIATKYRDATTSDIKINVKAGEATKLDLKLDPP